jgi:lipopolysaccharide/colanic/teichoic acid biosynthesis glycosyltransferase
VITSRPPAAKLVFDKLVGTAFLLLSTPLWIAIACAILIESALSRRARGPLFHTETRVSAGRPFKLYKFRILTPEAEEAIRGGERPKAIENDPRNLTRTGWLLKKIGVDELPQLLHVVSGSMSFVGPRPKPVAEYHDEIANGHDFRAELRAGLTGPTQILKGTAPPPDQGTNDEFAYAEMLRTASAWRVLATDTRILLSTIRVLLRAAGE